MGLKTGILWCDVTWNPWQGCTKVSPACTHCYMFRDMKRYGRDPSIVVRSKPPTFNLPLKRTKGEVFAIPDGAKVFTCSWSDWFHKDADAWRDEAWAIVRRRPDVVFQIVTKRTERIAECLPDDWGLEGYRNVWLIATVENQEYADLRIPQLLEIPAAVHGLSVEPMLGPVDLTPYIGGRSYRCDCGFHRTESELVFSGGDKWACVKCGKRCVIGPTVGWVIIGGESGPESRPMNPRWVRDLIDQSRTARVPVFFKQFGNWASEESGAILDTDKAFTPWADTGDFTLMYHIGNDRAGDIFDGVRFHEFPIVAR